MMKKVFTAGAIAVMTAAAISTAAFADGKTIDVDGIHFTIPEEISDQVTIRTDDEGMIVSIYETASMEAAQEEDNGAGWIFGISRLPESEVRQLRCGGMDGMEVFAGEDGDGEEEDSFLIYNHPTDVRLVRATNEEMQEGAEAYGEINAWAYETVRDEILANNPALEPEAYTNTTVDMYLAKAAYEQDVNYAVISLQLADQDLPIVEAEDHLKELAENYCFTYAEEEEAPDGEYIALTFPDDEIRFDFFAADPSIVREVATWDGEEHETFYLVSGKDGDGDDTPYSIMHSWVEDILEGEN